MKKLVEYLDDAKAITGSDYKTAQIMGVTRSAISNYRAGRNTPDEYGVFQLAEILKISERELFIDLAMQKEKNPEKRHYWEKLGGVAAKIFLSLSVTVIFQVTPTPSQAAPTLEYAPKPLYIM
jgi:transcriptional regulator with XRE-family HTH domain